MPPFTSFRVLAALRVNGVQSGFSEQSNIISKYMGEGRVRGWSVRCTSVKRVECEEYQCEGVECEVYPCEGMKCEEYQCEGVECEVYQCEGMKCKLSVHCLSLCSHNTNGANYSANLMMFNILWRCSMRASVGY